MKIVFNETQTLVILLNGHLKLYPKGAAREKDRQQIQDRDAENPDVKRFAILKKITILSLEEAAKRTADAQRRNADDKAAAAEKAIIIAERAKKDAEAAEKKVAKPVVPKAPEVATPVEQKPAEQKSAAPTEVSNSEAETPLEGRKSKRNRN